MTNEIMYRRKYRVLLWYFKKYSRLIYIVYLFLTVGLNMNYLDFNWLKHDVVVGIVNISKNRIISFLKQVQGKSRN